MELECLVDGALATVLRVMRVLGVIPVRLIQVSGGYLLRYSFAQDIICRFFHGSLSLLTSLSVLWHVLSILTVNGSTVGKIMPMMWLGTCSSIVRSILIFVVVLKGSKRTKQLVKNIEDIRKLNIQGIHDAEVLNVEKRRTILFFAILIIPIFLIILETSIGYSLKIIIREGNTAAVQHIFIGCGHFLMIPLEAQFFFTVLSTHTALQALNRCIKKLLIDFKLNKNKSENITSAHKTLRRLAVSYDALCDIMKRLNEENGAMILTMLPLLLVDSLLSGYLLAGTIQSIKLATGTEDNNTFHLILAGCRCFTVLINTLLLIEPCQWTYNEMEVTRLFVIRMAHYAPSLCGPLHNELEMFYRLVYTNIPSYSPLELFTVDRFLLLKMIATVTSYVFIVLQYNVTS